MQNETNLKYDSIGKHSSPFGDDTERHKIVDDQGDLDELKCLKFLFIP